jgi:hypothetical protein
MSILKSIPKKTAAEDPSQPMLEPEEALEQLRAIQSRIPEFVQPANDRQMKLIRRRAGVSVEFAREAISAVGASDTVQHIVGNTPAELRAAEAEIGRWSAVEAELRAILRGVIAANTMRRERLGLAALQVFNVSRELVRQEDHAELWPHVEAMRRMPKYNRRRKPAVKTAEPANAAEPSKVAEPPQQPKTA